MPEKIKIDFISDIVCPWCIIAYKNLQQALIELGIEDQVEIEWQPFELNPDMPAEGEHLQKHSARKYGSTPESSSQFRVEMAERGKEVGFKFSYFEDMKIVNTRDAHILLEYAKEAGLQTELKLRLFSAFFTEQKDISDREVLVQEITTIGLNAEKALARLDDNSAIEEIKEIEYNWHRLGISSVPTVVLNRNSAISGAHPVSGFKDFIASQIQS